MSNFNERGKMKRFLTHFLAFYVGGVAATMPLALIGGNMFHALAWPVIYYYLFYI